MTELVILTTNRKLRTGEELVDIFDTCGTKNPGEWEWVAFKVRRADAEIIVAVVNAARKSGVTE